MLESNFKLAASERFYVFAGQWKRKNISVEMSIGPKSPGDKGDLVALTTHGTRVVGRHYTQIKLNETSPSRLGKQFQVHCQKRIPELF